MINFGDFLKFNLSVVPVKKDEKRPALPSWTKYQTTKASEEEAFAWSQKYDRIGIVGGVASGGLEILDFDNHQGDAKLRFETFKDTLESSCQIFNKLTIETTPSGGYHVFYRYEADKYDGNQKLASVKTNEGKSDCFIETRGQGGQVVASPTEGYILIQNDFNSIPTISREERNRIIEICKAFDELPKATAEEIDEAEKYTRQIIKENNFNKSIEGSRFDEANKNIDTEAELLAMGWTPCGRSGDMSYWKRPGKKDKGISATFNHNGNGKLFVFTTNSEFENGWGYNPSDVVFVRHFGRRPTKNDSKACLQLMENEGYLPMRKMPQPIKMDAVKNTKPKENTVQKNATTTVKQFTQEENTGTEEKGTAGDHPTTGVLKAFNGIEELRFWYVTPNKANPENGIVNTSVSKMMEYLEYKGFRHLKNDVGAYSLIRITNNIIDMTDLETMATEIRDVLDILPDKINDNPVTYKRALQDAITKQNKTILDSKTLLLMKKVDLQNQILRDTKDTVYKFFRNKVVKITKDEYNLIDYKDCKGYVWREWILERDTKEIPQEEAAKSVIFNFDKNLCRTQPDIDDDNYNDRTKWEINQQKLDAMVTMNGYLLSNYKDPVCVKIPSLIEEEESPNGDSNGRTGKGLKMKIISKYTSTVLIDGKTIDEQNRFNNSTIAPYTNLVVYDDLKYRFNWESLFSQATEGITIEKKNKQAYRISAEKAPKFATTSNYVPEKNSPSFTDRVYLMEHSPYYSINHRPSSEHNGKLFFAEDWWNEKDENGITEGLRTDGYMFWCIQEYLEKGLLEYTRKNVEQRRIDMIVAPDIQEFGEKYLAELRQGGRIAFSDVWDDFRNNFVPSNPLYLNVKQKTFSYYITTFFSNKIPGVVSKKFRMPQYNNQSMKGWGKP